MKGIYSIGALILVLAAFLASAASAKGPVDKLTVEGRMLGTPLEITNQDALQPFDPWTRGFIDWTRGSVREPPSQHGTFTVAFYVDDQRLYVLEYFPSQVGESGFIYIPGREHAAYSLNVQTISSGSSDKWDPNGKWHYATPQWDELILTALVSFIREGEEEALLSPTAGSGARIQAPGTGDGGLLLR